MWYWPPTYGGPEPGTASLIEMQSQASLEWPVRTLHQEGAFLGWQGYWLICSRKTPIFTCLVQRRQNWTCPPPSTGQHFNLLSGQGWGVGIVNTQNPNIKPKLVKVRKTNLFCSSTLWNILISRSVVWNPPGPMLIAPASHCIINAVVGNTIISLCLFPLLGFE